MSAAQAISQDQPTAARPAEPAPELIDLPSGKELNETSAIRLGASTLVRLVVLAGPVDSGKTTLLTSLYELFQLNPVCGQNFAGSMTLPAFEMRCHLARTASESATAQTERTVYKGPDPFYLHLRTASAEPPHAQADFLFTDVSGEMFEHAQNSTSECKELRFLHRASHFLLLLDGEKAVRPERWGMIQKSKTMLESCLDAKMLPSFCAVNVVWAKYDYFEAAPDRDKEQHQAFRDEVVGQFQTAFRHRVGQLKFRQVAARPKQAPKLGFGKGVPELFKDWVTDYPQSRRMDLQPEDPVGTRESELFEMRHFKSFQKR